MKFIRFNNATFFKKIYLESNCIFKCEVSKFWNLMHTYFFRVVGIKIGIKSNKSRQKNNIQGLLENKEAESIKIVYLNIILHTFNILKKKVL